MATSTSGSSITAQAIAKAAEKSKEKELVEVWRFMDEQGKDYWAQNKKSPNHISFPMQSKMVEKGSKEDQ